jgi:hypothetical protein
MRAERHKERRGKEEREGRKEPIRETANNGRRNKEN